MVIAIDGPAGAGKSTVAKGVAAALGFTYLDTGVMYRCVALISFRSERPWQELAVALDVVMTDRVFLAGEDVSVKIRTPEVAQRASEVAASGPVRSALVEKQQKMICSGNHVVEGRDIGGVVAPAAEVKIFLTATPEARAARRADELGLPLAGILVAQAERDARDSKRDISPLTPAAEAHIIDSSDLDIPTVIAAIVNLTKQLPR